MQSANARPRGRFGTAVLFGLFALGLAPAAAQTVVASAEVFVLTTLYWRHESTPSYDHRVLRRLIERTSPKRSSSTSHRENCVTRPWPRARTSTRR